MSLYIPPAFEAGERGAATRLIDDYPFATLITPAADEPLISHLPLLLIARGTADEALIGHFARANPHWRKAGAAESIAIFHGPHAYVSPSFYAAPEAAVPTWNYAVAHAHGTLEIARDDGETRAVLDRLIARFESSRERPWQIGLAPDRLAAMVGAIVGFRMPVRRLDVKFKMSQNRSGEDRSRVAAALAAEGYAEATATAQWMQAYARPRTGES